MSNLFSQDNLPEQQPKQQPLEALDADATNDEDVELESEDDDDDFFGDEDDEGDDEEVQAPVDPKTELVLQYGTESVRVFLPSMKNGITYEELARHYAEVLYLQPKSIATANFTSGGQYLERDAAAQPGQKVVISIGHEAKGY